ncbi:MAG: hypothetical protein Q7S22_06455 [Candidatus Micrarchaeota archaeon]|nr:hypothetical protein [Candidatus Micrarchaeota archaeon]
MTIYKREAVRPISKGPLRLAVGYSVVSEGPESKLVRSTIVRRIEQKLKSRKSTVREEGMRMLMEEHDRGNIPEDKYLRLLGKSIDVVLHDSSFLVAFAEATLDMVRSLSRRRSYD